LFSYHTLNSIGFDTLVLSLTNFLPHENISILKKKPHEFNFHTHFVRYFANKISKISSFVGQTPQGSAPTTAVLWMVFISKNVNKMPYFWEKKL